MSTNSDSVNYRILHNLNAHEGLRGSSRHLFQRPTLPLVVAVALGFRHDPTDFVSGIISEGLHFTLFDEVAGDFGNEPHPFAVIAELAGGFTLVHVPV